MQKQLLYERIGISLESLEMRSAVLVQYHIYCRVLLQQIVLRHLYYWAVCRINDRAQRTYSSGCTGSRSDMHESGAGLLKSADSPEAGSEAMKPT